MTARTHTIAIERAAQSKLAATDLNNLQFGRTFTDHMLVATYDEGAWQDVKIQPYGALAMSPSISALHYGQAVFEGMKAYKNAAGEALLFRPHANHARINQSAARLCMPPIPDEVFIDGLLELVRLDADWIPTRAGSALYLRPIYFASDESVGLRPSERYTFAVIACPVNSYYAEPVKLTVTRDYVRAFAGGTGAAKAAGNYAASLLADREAKARGFDNVLWLDGKEQRYIEECGTMNVFFTIDDVVVTPKLSGSILPGITRDSIIKLLPTLGVKVEERTIAIDELAAAFRAGQLQEAFGAGTAATIAQIASIQFDDLTIALPPVADRPYSSVLATVLSEIKTGCRADEFGWMVRV
ncbi:MAG: branched-chain amino acid aminotransferase [Coleofasciculaceae cyanobacterium RL_1_1]|nr:branched-chain amino acid aminotransferase [Coleofasciculaceae cyanobacterium RL_1_1]